MDWVCSVRACGLPEDPLYGSRRGTIRQGDLMSHSPGRGVLAPQTADGLRECSGFAPLYRYRRYIVVHLPSAPRGGATRDMNISFVLCASPSVLPFPFPRDLK